MPTSRRAWLSSHKASVACIAAVFAFGLSGAFAVAAFAPTRHSSLGERELKPIVALHAVTYLFVPTAGKYKNQAADAVGQLGNSAKYLRSRGVLKWKWIKRTCDYYDNDGTMDDAFPPKVVAVCNNETITRADVEAYAATQRAGPPA